MYLYVDANTALHKLNPVTKILGLLLLFFINLIFSHPLFLLLISGFILLVATISRSLAILKRFWMFLGLLMFFSLGLWSLFRSGFYGLAMGIRLVNMISSGLVFLSSTKIEEFTYGLNRLGLPFRAGFALSLAFRLVPTLMGKADLIVQAQTSRGLEFGGGSIFARLRRYLPLIVPILASSIRFSDLLASALESKAFGFTHKRTSYLRFRTTFLDYLVMGILISVLPAIRNEQYSLADILQKRYWKRSRTDKLSSVSQRCYGYTFEIHAHYSVS